MEAASFEEGEKGGGDEGAAASLGAKIIIAADDGAAEGTLGGVVVERDGRVVEEAREAVPDFEGVVDGVVDR